MVNVFKKSARWRVPVYAILLFAFVAAGLISWHQLTLLNDRITAISNATRFDEWSLNELTQDIERLGASIAYAAVLQDGPSFDAMLDRLDIAWSRIPPVRDGAKGRALLAANDHLGVVLDQLEVALTHTDTIIDALDGQAPDAAVLQAATEIITPFYSELYEIVSLILQVQLEAQDQNIDAIHSAVELNRRIIKGSLISGVLLFGLIALEAWSALRARRVAISSESRFRAFAKSSSDWLWETDASGRLIYLSGGDMETTTPAFGADIGKNFAALFDEAREGERDVSLQAYLDRQMTWRDIVATIGLAAGHTKHFRLCGEPMMQMGDQIAGARGTMTDITSEVEQNRQIRFMAERDSLTGLYTRSRLLQELEKLFATLDRSQDLDKRKPYSNVMLLLDLDGFKAINDTFGHDVGDALLVSVAERIAAELPENSMLARLGGDEFGIILPPINEVGIADIARRLIRSIRDPQMLMGQRVAVGTSIGAARLPVDAVDPISSLKAADLALYKAKTSNRGQLVHYRRQFSDALERRTRIEHALRAAIDGSRLDFLYQPICTIDGHQIAGAEVLVRWTDPELGSISPSEFIPIAEETGLILPLGEKVLRAACLEARSWPKDLFVSVNVSPAQFQYGNLLSFIRELFPSADGPVSGLQLELTEGLLIDEGRYVELLRDLVAMGCRLAIDDFGTGYSSLSYLNRLPVSHIKIDGRFVRHLDDDASDRTVTSAMFGELGMSVTAECVETQSQLDYLRGRGCAFAQGYLLGKPMPAQNFRKRIERMNANV